MKRTRFVAACLALATLALNAGNMRAAAETQGINSWTLYKGAGPSKSLVFETNGNAPFAVLCDKYELSLWVVSPETSPKARTGSFSLAGANKQFFFYSGPTRQDRAGIAIQVPLTFSAPVFALIEKGDFLVRETSGKVIAEIKIANPQMTDFVYNCRKP